MKTQHTSRLGRVCSEPIRVFAILVILGVLSAGGRHAPAQSTRVPGVPPTDVSIMPPTGARFLPGQRFDIRVEGRVKGKENYDFSATLKIGEIIRDENEKDEKKKVKIVWEKQPLEFTSGYKDKDKDPSNPSNPKNDSTDGISDYVPGREYNWGGFNRRGYSKDKPGKYVLEATFSAAGVPFKDSKDCEKDCEKIHTEFEIVAVEGNAQKVKNIIIMLGDGMGAAHRTAARLVRYGVKAGTPQGWLAMDKFPGTGFVTTHSLNSIVTDSAPGMSCYSTGNHADNEQEGVFPAHVTNPFYAPRVEYMSEYLRRMIPKKKTGQSFGKALGLVTTADVEDATPAANAVHTANRTYGTGICDQYFDERNRTGLRVLMGGGRRWFLPADQKYSSRGACKKKDNICEKKDGKDVILDYEKLPDDLKERWGLTDEVPAEKKGSNRDLLCDFQAQNFKYVETASALNDLEKKGIPDKLLGLFAFGNMNAALDKIDSRRYKELSEKDKLSRKAPVVVEDYHAPDQPMLDEMTRAALKVLNKKNDDGFVLMVEGAHIDKQSHMMDTDRMIDEVIEFDSAVKVAYDFATNSANDTLVIVLADHECSGLSLFGAFTDRINLYDKAGFPKYSKHNPDDGYPETFDIDGKLIAGFGANADRYETWRQKALPLIDTLLPENLEKELKEKGYLPFPPQRDDHVGFFIGGQISGSQTAVHTATDIPVSSYSYNSDVYQLFYGVHENTCIFFKLMCATLGGSKRSDICPPKR